MEKGTCEAATLTSISEQLQAVVLAVHDLKRGQGENSALLSSLSSKLDNIAFAARADIVGESCSLTTRADTSIASNRLALKTISSESWVPEGGSSSWREEKLPKQREEENAGEAWSSKPSIMGGRVRALMLELERSGNSSTIARAPCDKSVGPFQLLVCCAQRLVTWRPFEHAMGVVILADLVTIGLQTQMELDGNVPVLLRVLEHIFLIIYILELCCRVLAWGRKCLREGWYLFDLALVLAGATSLWFVDLGAYAMGIDLSSVGRPELLQQFMVARVCRFLRLLRSLRMLQQFRSMWRLIYGLLNSFTTMASTLALVCLVLYAFACLGLELITKDRRLAHDTLLSEIVDDKFGSLGRAMVFLVQFVTLDDVAGTYVPLVRSKPELILYFGALILVVSISLMNMVMATIVEGALAEAHADRELEREQQKDKIRSLTPKLQKLFGSVDVDGNGCITLEELEQLRHHDLDADVSSLIGREGVSKLFAMLDVDSSGEVSRDEFIEGILTLTLSEIPLHEMELLQLARFTQRKIVRVAEQLESHITDHVRYKTSRTLYGVGHKRSKLLL